MIAIIGVLVALLLPAIQAAREAARNAQCKSHLRQIGLAMINYESGKKEFPAGGWGFRWMGDPDMAKARSVVQAHGAKKLGLGKGEASSSGGDEMVVDSN